MTADRHGVYPLRGGRLCVAGLNQQNVGIAAEAIASVMRTPSN